MNRRGLPVTSFLTLLALLIAPHLSADIVDRHPLADPRDELIEARPDRVVASGEMFLVHGQRITTEGVNLDEGEPIRGAEGFAVPWPDGWLIIRSSHEDQSLSIAHLAREGSFEAFLEPPRAGEFVDAASNGGRLAILEKVHEERGSSLWVTVANDEGIIRRARLARLDDGVIRPFDDGFLAVTTVRASPGGHDLHAWRLREDGEPDLFRDIDRLHYGPELELATTGNHAVLTTRIFGGTVRIIGPDLSVSEPVVIEEPAGTDLTRLFPLPVGDRFLVSYGFRSGGENALIVNRDGKVLSNEPADPIVAGDRAGSHYLVLRPWGDAGLAVDDPRVVVKALEMKRRLYQPPRTIETIVSGKVTLAWFDYWRYYHFQQPGATLFVRFDEEGGVIDDEAQPFVGRTVFAIPGGFAFLTVEDGAIRMRRLDGRAGWIDETPIVLAEAPDDVRAIAGSATDDDLLVAWATAEEIFWSRFDLEGMPLQDLPSRVERGDTRSRTVMGISRSEDVWLLLLYDDDICRLSPCVTFDLYESLAIDRNGEPLGPLHELDIHSPSVRAVGLPDGTWAVPLGPHQTRVMHLARDGSLLGISTHPLLEDLIDFAPAPGGWKAFTGAGLIELIGLDSPMSLTGIENVSSPRFAAGTRMAFLDDAPGFEQTIVPCNGRIEATNGDLSIRLLDVGRTELERKIRIEVTNLGMTTATNVSVSASDHTVYFGPWRRSQQTTLAELGPGETATLFASIRSPQPALQFLVTSASIRDVEVENNSVLISEAEPLLRRRTVRQRP
ncbi:MAG: hypothetical protein R3338_07400 [Thermoanaerobaculia bacterium]|nr:hypothetical protein [Thermoanaerobaculia bacterium]